MPQTIETKNADNDTLILVDEMLKNGDNEKAESCLNEMLTKSPNNSSLLNALGTVHVAKGDLARAADAFKKAITIKPDFCDAYYNLGLVNNRQSHQSEAIENFLQVVRLNPHDSVAQNDLGALYYAQGKSLLAKGHFIRALEASPLYKNALMNLFELCWNEGAYDEALIWMERFLKVAKLDQNGSPEMSMPKLENKAAPTKSHVDLSHIPSHSIADKTRNIRQARSAANDIFMKHVPAILRGMKTGMHIAIVGDFNIAGQLSLLMRMINQHTIHKARMIILQGDYLSYDKDIILSEGHREDYEEALNIIRNADFYHVGRFPINFGEIDWSKILRPDNSVIQYYGSEIRWNAEPIYKWHSANKIIGVSCWDYTMLENAPLFYHINIMCDLSRIKPCQPPEDIIRICHPPTNRSFKRTDLFLAAVQDLQKKYPVEVELIEGKSNEECLDIKSRCHITFDQISVGIYGLSAIESMAAGHAVLCGISNFASSYHPDNPIVYVHENNLIEKIEYLLTHREEITRIGEAGKAWARTHHNPLKIVQQFTWIYDLVVNGHRLAENRDSFMIQ
jgi:tetratricopeptide (TPR) repeat protein